MKPFFFISILITQVVFAKFESKQIKIGQKTITVEIANTNAQRRLGLMNRTNLAEDDGMLFIFEHEQSLSFWMKNTKIPLSVGYFDKNKKLINILDMQPAEPYLSDYELKVYKSARPALYALEMNLGWFKKNNIRPEAKFSFSK